MLSPVTFRTTTGSDNDTHDDPGVIPRLALIPSNDARVSHELVDERRYDGRREWFRELDQVDDEQLVDGERCWFGC